jgi:hypothetical protein
MLDGLRTEEEVLELRRIISVYNKVADPAPAPWEREGFDADGFLAWLDASEADDQDFRGALEETKDVRPLSELLDLCGITVEEEPLEAPETDFLAELGFSPEDQLRAERTARRQARKAQRALQSASDDDWEY